MAQIPVIGVGLFAVGILTVLAIIEWRKIAREMERQNLASALTGEIAAILRVIEVESISPDAPSNEAATDTSALPLVLPHFTIYEANAGKLDFFAPPLPRKIAYFFDRLGALAQDYNLIATTSLSATGNRAGHLRNVRSELKLTLDLADEILLALRPIVSPHTSAKHLA